MKETKIKIGLVYGGKSAEHEVSVRTAEQILLYLDKKKYRVIPIYISKEGVWPKTIKIDQLYKKIDVAFIAMHGPSGEDGTMQGFFETLGIPYTFSGVLASSLAMDKYKTQLLLSGLAIKSPQSVLVSRYSFAKQKLNLLREIKHLGDTIVIKPNRLGSSVGVHRLANKSDAVTKALKDALKHDTHALAQQYIQGREVTAAILGNERPQGLPLIEIIPTAKNSDFYDYTAKYTVGGSEHVIPAKLGKAVSQEINTTALIAHMTLGCRGVSRSDFIVTEDHAVYYLETNTIPGMTSTSLLPQAAAKAGISFPKLLDTIIQLAL
jgi:D-alanine-D-alanine ligase